MRIVIIQNIEVMKTRARPLGIEIVVGDPDNLNPSDVFGAIFQYPGTFGHVKDFTSHIEKLHENKAIAVIAADPFHLHYLRSQELWGLI